MTNAPAPTAPDATRIESAPVLHGDSSLMFLLEGYMFGHRRFERFDTDALRTRLMGRSATLLRGLDAARFFYEGARFTRQGAMPRSVLHSLQDEGSVQTLTGAPHTTRKTIFTRILDAGGDDALAHAFADEWDRAQALWVQHDELALMPAVEQVLTDAALRWLGISEPPRRRRELAREAAAMIDGAGSFGPRNWRGRMLRQATERWARDVVRTQRTRRSDNSSPLAILCSELRDDEVAATELLNLLRPTVAVARFIAFAALALHQHPLWRQRARDDDTAASMVAQEVRRAAPFFPAIGGRATASTEWRGIRFGAGDWVIVDLFATNRHPREWENAWEFDPSRFTHESPERVVAQGAGPIALTHRCPGEPVTGDLLAVAIGRLARSDWRVLPQNLDVDLSRLPARAGSDGMLVRFRS
ncbi:cytochrome P450 [Paramicrobacterium agarici]|uniref:cytochrome P450 n=1 Tax=Paramicrobacterium agarici TaxID=630514 RepID=UPI0011504EBC|nr:cytochrome P450 [Microbacterium agarici]TQO22458.1 fatty-acid peroxygenase [Microbacterium agarici]